MASNESTPSKSKSRRRAPLTNSNHLEFKKLSLINGEINKMTHDEVIRKLREMKLESRGHKDILKKRLKSYYRKQKFLQAKIENDPVFFDFLVIIDFEATCEIHNPPNYQYEIIEFPALLINTFTLRIVDQFHSYCRPVIHPQLSDFCITLTGITQDKVDKAQSFPVVLSLFQEWLVKHELGTKYSFAVVTDGPWDMGKFLFMQTYLTKSTLPNFAKKWINLRKTYCNFYNFKRTCLSHMLECLGMKFEGRPHCGLDDARNISRIVLQMLEDGCEIRINEKLRSLKPPVNDSDCLVVPVSRKEFLKDIGFSDVKEFEDVFDDDQSDS